MTLHERKLQIINRLIQTSDKTFIDRVEKLLSEASRSDYEKSLKPMSQKELIQRALRSEESIASGKVFTQKQVEQFFHNRKKK